MDHRCAFLSHSHGLHGTDMYAFNCWPGVCTDSNREWTSLSLSLSLCIYTASIGESSGAAGVRVDNTSIHCVIQEQGDRTSFPMGKSALNTWMGNILFSLCFDTFL